MNRYELSVVVKFWLPSCKLLIKSWLLPYVHCIKNLKILLFNTFHVFKVVACHFNASGKAVSVFYVCMCQKSGHVYILLFLKFKSFLLKMFPFSYCRHMFSFISYFAAVVAQTPWTKPTTVWYVATRKSVVQSRINTEDFVKILFALYMHKLTK